jgi:hypothetical protein
LSVAAKQLITELIVDSEKRKRTRNAIWNHCMLASSRCQGLVRNEIHPERHKHPPEIDYRTQSAPSSAKSLGLGLGLGLPYPERTFISKVVNLPSALGSGKSSWSAAGVYMVDDRG